MEPDINKDSLCIIRKEREAIHGKIMLVQTEDGFTIKRIIKKGAAIELHPTNGIHKVIKPKELRVIGQVIGTWKRIE